MALRGATVAPRGEHLAPRGAIKWRVRCIATMAPFWRHNGAILANLWRHVAPCGAKMANGNFKFAIFWRHVATPPRGDVQWYVKLCSHRHMAPNWRHMANCFRATMTSCGAEMAPLWRHVAPLLRHVAIGNFRIEAIFAHNGATWRMAPIWRHVANLTFEGRPGGHANDNS